MDFYKELIEVNEEQLEDFIKDRIGKKEVESFLHNEESSLIGYDLNINPRLLSLEDNDKQEVGVNCFHSGYIPIGTKIVYGMSWDDNGVMRNDGKYYYVDTEDYIYEFCRMIREKEITNEYELMDYILEFIRNYFKILRTIERDDMFNLIDKSEIISYHPKKEHGLSWFRGKGNALCSEYSVLSQNIMTLFGFDSYLVIGRERDGEEKEESHAFNLVEFIEDESKELTQLLVDYSNYVDIYDINFKKVGELPYIAKLESLDEEFVKELIYEEKHLTFSDYCCLLTNEHLGKMLYERDRDYYIANDFIPDFYVIKKKI